MDFHLKVIQTTIIKISPESSTLSENTFCRMNFGQNIFGKKFSYISLVTSNCIRQILDGFGKQLFSDYDFAEFVSF